MPEEELVEQAESQITPEGTEPLVDEPAAAATDPAVRPRAYKVIHPTKLRRRRPAAPREGLPLSLLAGLLGLLSLAFVWNYEPARSRGYDVFTALRYIADMGDHSAVYSAIVLLIMVGSILCFITSLGSLLQLGGVILYAFEFAGDSIIAGPGPFVAVAATLIGVASLLVSPHVKVPSRFVSLTRNQRGNLSVNILSFSAFGLGILSVLLIWVVQQYSLDPSYQWLVSYTPEPVNHSLLSFLFDARVEDISLIIVGSSLLIAGSVLCLLTPLGSLAQTAGTVLCFLEIRSSFSDTYHVLWTVDVDIGPGLYVAVVAAVVGLLSMVFVRRLEIPDMFASGALAQLEGQSDLSPGTPSAQKVDSVRLQVFPRLQDLVPRMVRTLVVVAVVIALAISALAVPGVLPLSAVKVYVGNASPLYDIDLEIYIDGEAVASGTVTPFNEYIFEHRVRSGVHALGLDYAFSGDEDPAPDGSPDWSSSVDVDPYMTSSVFVSLMGDFDIRTPQVNLSSAASPDGFIITLESVFRYDAGVGMHPADVDWSSISLVVVEAYVSGAGWSFHGYELDDVPYDMEYCGIQYLGSLGLNCTAYDISGDGEAGAGDFITLSVSEGAFSSSSEYIAYVLYEPYDSVIGQVTISG